MKTMTKIYEDIQEIWTPSNVCLIHWDGKLMDTLDGSMKSKRLPVLLSGENGIKLLRVPEIPTSADLKKLDLAMKVLRERKVSNRTAAQMFEISEATPRWHQQTYFFFFTFPKRQTF